MASIIVLAADSRAHATQPLGEFLAAARAYAFDTRETAALHGQREAESDVALGRLLPAFSARGLYTHNQYSAVAMLPGAGTLVIQPGNQWDAYLQLDVPLVDLASYYRYRSSGRLADLAKEQEASVAIDVARSVARAYYQFIGASALLRAAEASLHAAEANLQNVADRQGAGAATDLDRERASANVERARQDLADAELAIALSGRALETLSGVAPTPAEEFPSDDLHDEGELEPWLALSGRTPQDRAAQAAERAALDARSAAKAAYLPVLSGSALERFTNATGFSHHSAFYALQLILTWRLDYSTVVNEHAQAAALEVQKVRVERTARAVADAIFEAYRRIQAGLAKSRAARSQSTAAARAAELAVDRYSIGVATQLDVTQAQRDAYASDAARIQADADLAYARVALRLAANTALDRRTP